MPAKIKGRNFFTEQQRQQIIGTYDYLRELHRDAYPGLRQLGGSTSADKRADVLLSRMAEEIGSAVKFLVEILSSAQEQVRRVVFEVSVTCGNCTAPLDETTDNSETGPPLPDPAHLPELDGLFDFADRRGRRRARRMRHKNSTDSFRGHKKFMAALTKERRYFRETAAASPAPIEFRVNGPDCSVCHQPAKIIDPIKN
jgi:hypothetical protein